MLRLSSQRNLGRNEPPAAVSGRPAVFVPALRQLQEELDQQLKRYTVAQLLEAPTKNVQ